MQSRSAPRFRCGSWPCKNAGAPRRCRIRFSLANRLAASRETSRHGGRRLKAAENPQTLRFMHSKCVTDVSRSTHRLGDLRASWNRILAIFALYTFSHSQGHLCTTGATSSLRAEAASRPNDRRMTSLRLMPSTSAAWSNASIRWSGRITSTARLGGNFGFLHCTS